MIRPIKRERSVAIQTRDAILDLIAEQKLSLGDKLPSEEQLTTRLEVSRPTLREAFKLLEQDGVIRVEHGKGRFLASGSALQVERPITCFESVTEMVRGFGYETTSDVLSVQELDADEEIAAGLQCEIGSAVVRIERIRRESSKPLIYSLDYVRREALGGELEPGVFTGSLVELLRRRALAPVMSTARASAVLLPPDVARRHRLGDFGPALLIAETCYTAEGRPVLFAKDYHRGDAFTFSFVRK